MKENVIVSHKETIEPIFSFMRTYINHFALLIKPILGLSEWCPIDSLICLSNLPAKKKKEKRKRSFHALMEFTKHLNLGT